MKKKKKKKFCDTIGHFLTAFNTIDQLSILPKLYSSVLPKNHKIEEKNNIDKIIFREFTIKIEYAFKKCYLNLFFPCF